MFVNYDCKKVVSQLLNESVYRKQWYEIPTQLYYEYNTCNEIQSEYYIYDIIILSEWEGMKNIWNVCTEVLCEAFL